MYSTVLEPIDLLTPFIIGAGLVISGEVYRHRNIFNRLNKLRLPIIKSGKSISVKKVKSSSLLPLNYGVNAETNEPMIGDLTKAPHLLLAGSTGSGKGVTLTNLLFSIIDSKEELELTIIDVKRTDFQAFTKMRRVNPIIYKLDEVVKFLNDIMDKHDERIELFVNKGVRNIQEYNALKGVERLPYNVIVVDEMAQLVLSFKGDGERDIKNKIVNLIVQITQICRATGSHMILTTQNPIVDVINSLIKANCTTRLGLRMATPANSMAMGVSGCHNIKSKNGYGIFIFTSSALILSSNKIP